MNRNTPDSNLFRLVVESSPNAIILVNREGKIVLVNAQAERLFGYTREELIGQQMELLVPERLRHQHATDRSHYTKAPTQRSMGAGRDLFGLRKDGKEVPIEIGLNPLEMTDGTHVLASIIDISERQYLQSQLLQAQKMESIGQLAGGIAHDFNNLLTAILGYAQTMKTYVQGKQAHEDLDEILKASQSAASLTRQLLTFSRRQVITPRILSIYAAVTDMQSLMRRLIREDIQLQLKLKQDAGNVKIDAGQLEQVVMNLVVNARDAMPQGGKLTIEASHIALDEDSLVQRIGVKPGFYVMLAVSDTGLGMTEEVQKKIFEPFFTTKAKGQGTGLGLATVYGIIKQSGGGILVYSHPGIGSTFKVFWPKVEDPASPSIKPMKPTEMKAASETLLIAEDEESVRKLVVRVLRGKGYHVLVAAHGKEAIRAAMDHEGRIHMLLTDLFMPEMNGRELAISLRGTRPGIKVLYMSGYSENIITHHGVLEDNVALMEKPFSPDTLCQKVREILDATEK